MIDKCVCGGPLQLNIIIGSVGYHVDWLILEPMKHWELRCRSWIRFLCNKCGHFEIGLKYVCAELEFL